MNTKRILLISLFLAGTIGIAYILYRVFFAPPQAVVQPTPGLPGTPGQFPTTGETEDVVPGVSGPTELPTAGDVPGGVPGGVDLSTSDIIGQPVTAGVVAPASDPNGQARFYSETDGKFYQLASDGSARELSDQVFFNVQDVTWSPTNNESIIEYPDGSNIYYNFNTKTQVTLPQHWEEFSFSSAGDQIAAKSMGLSPDNRWLVTSDPTGNNIRLVEPLGNNADKVIVDWSPNKQVLALARTGDPEGGDRQQVLLVGQNGENFKSITVEGRDLRTQWSPSGTKILHSVYSSRSDFKPELWIVNASGDSIGTGRKLLNLNTWADKCTFADDRFVYCAAPITMDTGVGFAPELTNSIRHELYRIDTQTGASTQIPLDQFHVINSVFLSENGQNLYFTDINQSGLFEVAI
jgi:WD40 repeat protein